MRKPIHAAGLAVTFLLAWPAGALMLDLASEGVTEYGHTPLDGGLTSYVSLKQIQIVPSSSTNLPAGSFDSQGLLNLPDAWAAYGLDGGAAENWEWLDSSLNRGGRSGDVQLDVAPRQFDRAGTGQYVYLYSRFGETYGAANDGYEDSDVQTSEQVVPEPAPLILMAVGLAGILGFKRKRAI